jgi:hypothetical protein
MSKGTCTFARTPWCRLTVSPWQGRAPRPWDAPRPWAQLEERQAGCGSWKGDSPDMLWQQTWNNKEPWTWLNHGSFHQSKIKWFYVILGYFGDDSPYLLTIISATSKWRCMTLLQFSPTIYGNGNLRLFLRKHGNTISNIWWASRIVRNNLSIVTYYIYILFYKTTLRTCE